MLQELTPRLDERQRRLMAGAGARTLGRGGIAAVARATGLSRATIRKGAIELERGPVAAEDRVRRPGGGRKRATERDPGLVAALEALVDPHTRGDPESPLRWTCKSTRQLADALTAAGHATSHVRAGELLRSLGYSLQANAKTREGKQHPDRDAQFRYINEQVRRHLRAGQPVISVDTKKKELIGADPAYKNAGREWQPTGSPERVGVHDFPDPESPKAIPYGIFDIQANAGFVVVGCDRDTASFAAQTLRRWWHSVGSVAYPDAGRLLICADAGGSNGYRIRLWKLELGRLASETGLQITVCHFPPGTSKWNHIEHRLFSAISTNWRGRPLTSHEVVVELIGATTTRGGLKVHAERDLATYPKGVTVTDQELASVPLKPHKFHGDWNYTVRPPKRASRESLY
jgi:Rhodopirellula transposase DDE domain